MSKAMFFDVLHRLQTATSTSAPTVKLLHDVAIHLSDPDIRREFFRELDSPAWIAVLNQGAFFADPPPAEKVADGGVRCQRWPQSEYLARMAVHAPEEVAEILATVETDNWIVARDMIKSARAMPAKHAAKLAPKIGQLVVELKLFHELQDIGEIVAKLAEGNEEDAALELVSKAFGMGLRDPTARRHQEDYGYLEGLHKSVIPALIPVRPSELVRFLVTLLRTAIEAEDGRRVEGDDHSYVWRPAIEDHEQNKNYNFAAKLVGCIRDALELAIGKNYLLFDEAIQILEEHDSVLLKRLRLHLIIQFADNNVDLARKTMLNKKLFDGYPYKHEYARLMKMSFQLLEKGQQAQWLSWIDDGPEAINPEFFDPSDDEATRKIQREYWQFKRLHWIRDHLTGDRKAFFDKMLAEHGTPKLVDLNVYSGGGRWGAASPYTAEQLGKMTFDEAVTAVTDWQPKEEERGFDEPTVEGLANNFRQYVASAPVAFSEQATLLIEKQALYVRSFLRSMEDAVKEGKLIDLPRVIDLCKWIIEQPVDQNTSPSTGDSPLLDRDWLWCRNTIADLAQAICKAEDDSKCPRYSLDLRADIWSVIKPLTDDPTESNVLHEDAEKDPRVTDWPMLALNAPRGTALQAVFDYADWVGHHTVKDRHKQKLFPGGFEQLPEVGKLLEAQLTRPDDYFTARAIFGRRLGLLYWLDKSWLEKHADTIFDLHAIEQEPSKAYGWAAWNTFLYACLPHIEFYKILREQFRYAVDQAAEVEVKRIGHQDPFELLGEHLIVLYGRGNLGEDAKDAWTADDGIIKKLVTQSHESVRSHAVQFAGGSLPEDGTDVPDGAIDRFIYLWEQYWEAVGQEDAKQNPNSYVFGRWFSCGAFEPAWSIEQLEKFVEAAPKADPDHMIMERLATICEVDPRRSARIVGMMVEGDDEGWRVGGWKKEAKAILSVAMKAGGESKAVAEQVIDRLGRRGFLDFGELLKKADGEG